MVLGGMWMCVFCRALVVRERWRGGEGRGASVASIRHRGGCRGRGGEGQTRENAWESECM